VHQVGKQDYIVLRCTVKNILKFGYCVTVLLFTVLPCYCVPCYRVTVYRVTKNPQTVPVLRQNNLFYNIHYTITRFNVVLRSFLQFFSSLFWMHSLTLSKLSRALPNHRLSSCHFHSILWTDRILNLYGNYSKIRKQLKFPENKSDIFPNCQTDYDILLIRLRVEVFKTLQIRIWIALNLSNIWRWLQFMEVLVMLFSQSPVTSPTVFKIIPDSLRHKLS
jgi:hypothetical protein